MGPVVIRLPSASQRPTESVCVAGSWMSGGGSKVTSTMSEAAVKSWITSMALPTRGPQLVILYSWPAWGPAALHVAPPVEFEIPHLEGQTLSTRVGGWALRPKEKNQQ